MRSRVFIPAVLLLSVFQAAFAQIQLIQDGGFESQIIAPWQLAGSGIGILSGVNANGGYAYAGAQYLSMGNFSGAVQYAYQTITFPTNLIGATLSLYYQTVSGDPNGDDYLYFYIRDTNNSPLIYLAYADSAHPTGGYVNYTTNLIPYAGAGALSSYAGQTVELYFYVTTDLTEGALTSFDIDNVSLLAATSANIPSNDNFTNATPILGSPFTGDVNTTYASKEPGEPYHAGNAGGHSVWWTWTAPAVGTVNINTTGSGFDTLLAVYTNTSSSGPAFNTLACVSSNNGAARSTGLASLAFPVPTQAQVGTKYYFALDGYNGRSGSAVLNFTFTQEATPSVAFSSPAAGAAVTNSSVLVKGTASDIVAVAYVQCQLSNATGANLWQLATTTNAWTNWTATVTNLIPGPNTVTIEAFNTSGASSMLVPRIFDYRVPAPLALSIQGRGAISGATNGLDLGFPYTITAKVVPGSGFAFTGWTGSIVTNTASLTFLMASNLTLIANFVDTNRPSLSITSPTAGQRWSNSIFAVKGTAKDNVQVSNCSLPTQRNRVAAGPDFERVDQLDGQPDAGVRHQHATGLCRGHQRQQVSHQQGHLPLHPQRHAHRPEAGSGGRSRPPTITSGWPSAPTTRSPPSASNHWLFSNWVASGSGNFVSNNPILTFTMQSNLVLQANFVTNVFLAAQGTYRGLFAPTNAPRRQTNSGAITLTVTSAGVLSGKLTLGASAPSLSGQFNPAGAAAVITPRKGESNLTTTLQLDFAGQTVSGSVTDGSFVAQVVADQEVFNSTHKAANYEGQYTFIIPGTNDSAVGPPGTSYGTVTVSPLGVVSFSVSLADGTASPVNPSSVVSKDGYWPFYLPLYSGNGSLWSWNRFTDGAVMSATGVSWINPTNTAKTALYRAGFTNEPAWIAGSAYSPTNEPLLALTNGQVLLEGGDLPIAITNALLLTLKNAILLTNAADTNKLALTITKASGVISGTFVNPSNPRQTISVNGVLLQNQTNAQGCFLGTNASGTFLLAPQ